MSDRARIRVVEGNDDEWCEAGRRLKDAAPHLFAQLLATAQRAAKAFTEPTAYLSEAPRSFPRLKLDESCDPDA